MSKPDPVTQAQTVLGEIAFDLLALQERLAGINRGLPVSPNQDAMLEGLVAPDLATEVSGRIECIAEDYLRVVIDALQGASCLTAHDLERAYRDERSKREWH